MTGIERALTLGLTLVGCVAAVIVVPEVRCAMGLETEVECTSGLGATPLLPRTALSTRLEFRPVEDPRIDPIRQLYRRIEENQPHFSVADVPLVWRGADSARATVYATASEIPKIRVRVYDGGELTSLLFYYTGSQLAFVHHVHKLADSDAGRWEQRFYFERGRMFRWLGPTKTPIPESDNAFGSNEAYLSRLGEQLRTSMEALAHAGT